MESETRSHLSLGQFFKRRFLKIYFPVLLITGLWLLIAPAGATNNEPVIYSLFWGFADPVMWFIRVLIPLYAIFYISSLGAKYIGWKYVSAIFIICCIAFSGYRQIYFDTIRDHSVPLFALGMLCSLYKQNGLSLMIGLILGTGIAVSCFSLLTTHPYTNFAHSFFDYILVVGVLFCVSVFRINWHLSFWLSAILFDIYLVHFKFLTVASQVWHMPLSLFLLLSIPASLALAYIFMRLRTSVAKTLRI